MNYLKLFISLLKFLRVLLIGGCGFVIFAAVMELFFMPIGVSWKTDAVFNVTNPFFDKMVWISIIAIGVVATLIFSLRACDAIIHIMLCFKHEEYFTDSNAQNFKKAGVNYLIAFLVLPIVLEIIHLIEYFLSAGTRLKIYGTDNVISLVKVSLFGLFLFVMGEVIQKAISIRKENDLTI